jgi:fatty acid desaturase
MSGEPSSNASEDPRHDLRLRAVPWRDLARLSPAACARELLLALPWLALSLVFADRQMWPLALAMSFFFFLSGLRVVHGAYHNALGLPRLATEWVMAGFSVLMLGSMHAIQWNHLRHHRHCLAADDIEAMGARRTALGALLLGPRFPVALHRAALAGAPPRLRAWIAGELLANVPLIALPLVAWKTFAYHVLAMAIGQCLTAFFAVWTVHRGCSEHGGIARTIRSPLRNALSFSMFFHLEHHLFPQVPTAHLIVLARRLDQAMPDRRWRLAW